MQEDVYVGFSTVDKDAASFRLTDIELVKRDLLNALQTRRGERVMRPEYGTLIYDFLMDPFDDETKSAIMDDARRVIEQDPRVRIVSMEAHELEHVMRLDVVLHFQPQDTADHLIIEYDRTNRDAI